MAATGNRSSDPGVKKGIFATVMSLNIHDHRCVMALKDHGTKLGNGIFDTEKLEARLEGVSDFGSFIGKQLIVTIRPLTPERANELKWSTGRWEVVGVRPRGIKPEPLQIPATYKTRGQRPKSYAPTIVYCNQDISSVPGVRPGPPGDKVAMVLHSFRGLLSKWGYFSVTEFYNVLKIQEEYSDAIAQFESLQDILRFIRAFPQYFAVTEDGRHLYFPYRFPEDEFKSLLRQRVINKNSRQTSDYDNYVVIKDVETCKREVRRLQQRARETNGMVVALDCEGVNLGKDGPLTLLQIGTEEGEVFVFDMLATHHPEDMFIRGGLKALLEDRSILKVIHDCRSDQCALHFQFGVTLTNVFDTSAAYTTIWEQCNVFAGPYRPKLALLLEIFGLAAKHKTDEFADLVHDKQLFGQRPLTREMIQYAADDVLCLVPVIYESLNKLISPLWRPHFEEKVEQFLAESRIRDPHEMYEQKD